MKRFLLFAVAVLAFVGCNEMFEDEGNARFEQTTLPTLTAGFEEDTRTYVEQNTNLRWHEGDLISAFLGNTLNNKYIFKGETGENSGTFSAVSSAELGSSYPLDNIYAIYPYDENTEMSKVGVISTLLPAEQTYAEESFGKCANTMVAVTENLEDTFLSFKNVGGYLKVKLYSDVATVVKSITIRGNNGEKIAGNANITATYGGVPKIAMADDATESIMLDCGDGVALSADAEYPTEFWFVLPPMEFNKGITISVTNAYDAVFEMSTSNKIVVERNIIQPMAAVEVEFEEVAKPANNEIWYTATEKVEPYKDNVFGAVYLSSTYDPTSKKGILTFKGDVTEIGPYAFSGCTSLTSITIPDSVTTIGEWAFHYCSSLTSITIPDSVTTIGERAFSGCKSLTSITIPDSVTTIGNYTFEYCSSLTSITVGDSVTKIGNSAFSGCKSLTSVTIPDSVTTIGDYAFRYCYSLTSITIPDSVTTLGSGAFAGCTSLKEFNGKFAADNGRCLIVDNTIIAYAYVSGTEYTIPNSVTMVGNWAFYDCHSITSITIPDSVTWIGDSTFRNCSSLTSITIPDSVTWIGDWAFPGCAALKEVYCKSTTPPTMGSSVFGDTPLEAIYVPTASVNDYKTADGWCNYADYIIGYDFDKGEIATPKPTNNEIWYTATEKVDPSTDNVFGATLLSNIYDPTTKEGVLTFDSDVTTIGERAFSDCYNLTSVTIGDSVTTIGFSAFASCESLTSITIPDSVTTIGDGAFAGCRNLKSITIPDSVTTIGDGAFSCCISLTSVTIPDSVASIGRNAFLGCDNLNTFYGKYASEDGRCLIIDDTLNSFAIGCGVLQYTIPNSVTMIGEIAFIYCRILTSVTIGNSVTSIGKSAFEYCSSLSSVIIGDSVTTIGYRAFAHCESLTSVYCKSTTPPSLESDAFPYTISMVYVPSGCGDIYKNSEWGNVCSNFVEYNFE